ncbi:dipeptidase [Acuticoccus sp. M5D2P5]|uniref:dipeptidase n=1 Tax=Acuticoccus kalidii TaxID=2910977 RepID=UPI001F2E6E19|nr:membrane dipeptidase [Acuticoccus kalidii]MCF3933391.1 dipeptidase [Acuticoccus kalidii]
MTNAADFHDDLIIVDTHVDTIQRQVDLGQDLTAPDSGGYMDLPSMKKGNLTATFFAACVDYNNIKRGTARQRQNQLLSAIIDFCDTNADTIAVARTSEDIRRLKAEGKLAAVITVEGAQAIEEDLAHLEELHRLGVVSIALAHFTSNTWADSSADVARHGGISDLGRKAIAEMNRLGMIIDVSHASDEAVIGALEASRAPIFASHSCARALHDHPRNLTDDLIRAIADKGGVVGPTIFPEYIYAPFQAATEVLAEEIRAEAGDDGPVEKGTPAITTIMRSFRGDMNGKYNSLVTKALPMPGIDVFVDHIAHIAALTSPAHVCVGTDHGAVRFDIPGWEDCTKLPALTDALLARGFSRREVAMIMGENVLRLMDDVQAVAG